MRQTMPHGERIRSTSLYTWARLPVAERGWRSWPEAHLYRLEIRDGDIVFEGDLDFFSDAKNAIANGADPAEAVAQYCSGNIKADGARVEVLVCEAGVLEKVYDASDHLSPVQRLLRRIRGQRD